ncbi:MAG TPA: adenylate/guanylate cyclase domain-containing protein [Acidimicrobiia bacterium]|nr:adenylate/guanylate cyclase domain-containing protein [Acidimicrobiia bacterium]
MEVPQTRYATAPDGARVACQVIGEGTRDILLSPNWLSSIDLMWDEPRYEHCLRRLAACGRLILFDKRGTGASDPLELRDGAFDVSLLEQANEDMLVVLDEVGSARATIIGADTGGTVAIVFAATHPERIDRLVLQDSCARVLVSDDYPHGLDAEMLQAIIGAVRERWGTGLSLGALAPSLPADASTLAWCSRYERLSVPPATMIASWEDAAQIDVRAVLPLIRVPTLVLSHDASELVPVGQGRYLADNIPDARHVELRGADIWLFADPRLADEIISFLGEPPVDGVEDDRVLAAVLFTDLVSSTSQLAEVGDRRWKDLLDTHDRVLGRAVHDHRGNLVDRAGDGMLATFDGPARAVRCATTIRGELRKVGLEMRAGVHAGEIELRGEGVAGIAVHLAARVMGAAGPGEVVVSRTVRDLTVGSGLEFRELGIHELKGIPGAWELFLLDEAPR